jgi:hypothetical protein
MKTSGAISVSLFLTCFVYGFSPLPAWDRVEGKSIAFFKGKGFEFSLDDSMVHHYEKPTLEISILIPHRFTDARLTNEFDSVMVLNEDISAELVTHLHADKKRVILTISEAMAGESEVIFSFRNGATNVTHGAQYVLALGRLLEEWKSGDKKPSGGVESNGGQADEPRDLDSGGNRDHPTASSTCYEFDEQFFRYFGSNGVAAVEKLLRK